MSNISTSVTFKKFPVIEGPILSDLWVREVLLAAEAKLMYFSPKEALELELALRGAEMKFNED